jgi:hypothetical protein
VPEENKPENFVSQLLHKIGVSEYFHRFKFGGFVGKLCVLGGLAVLAIAAVAFKLHNDWLIFASIILISALAALVILKVSDFANKHPELAMFEGAEILQWEQIKLAQKGVSTPLIGEPVPNPSDKLIRTEVNEGAK